MTKRRGRRNRKRRIIPIIIVAAVVVLLGAGGLAFYNSRYGPVKDVADLDKYYNLGEIVVNEGQENQYTLSSAGPDELAVVLNDEITTERAFADGGAVYVRYSFVNDKIDSRIYYDFINDIVIVTTATDIIKSVANEAGQKLAYSVNGGEPVALSVPITKTRNEDVYISMEFVDKFSASRSATFENPGRLVINSRTGPVQTAVVKNDTQIRVLGGNRSKVVAEVKKGAKVTVLEDVDGWMGVSDERGYIGYIKTSALGDIQEEVLVSDYDEPEYTHILKDGPVNMLWHGVYYYGQDEDIYTLDADVTGVNVISPRWYALKDEAGNLDVYSRSDYVEYVHNKGWEVWAMIDDTERAFVDAALADTNIRESIINTIVSDALAVGIDGLNLDFERISTASGDSFIQFVRELSIACRKNRLVLSVDNYTPYSYNACFHISDQSVCADYVVVMAYDNYVGTNVIGPNSSLDFLQEVMDVTLPQVDESRLVIGFSFYSRAFITANGETTDEEYVMADAIALPENYGQTATWDEKTGMDYAGFEVEGSKIQIWIENAKSIDKKLELLSGHNLAGAAWWRLGQETSDVWGVISKYY